MANEGPVQSPASSRPEPSRLDAPDEDLVRRVLEGHHAPYAELVQRYERAVYAAALSIVADRHAAQDVAQDAFTLAYEKLGALRDHRAFGGWLLQIARRHAIDHTRRKLQLVPLDHAQEVADHEFSTDETSDSRKRQILRAIGKLPDHEQRVLALRYFDGKDLAVIAKITSRSVGTVSKQISRALAAIRRRLKDLDP